MRTLRYLSVALAAALLIVDFAAGQKIDRYGDPLPEGAIARLGTTRLRHEANSLTGVAFSPDGKLLATAANNSSYVFVFDVATGERVAQFGPENPDEYLYWNGQALAFDKDSQSLLMMLLSGQVERLDVETGTRTSLGHPSISYRSVCATSDGRLVALRDAEDKIHVLEYSTLKPVAAWELGGESETPAFSFDAAGKLLALGDSKRKTFELWDVDAKKAIWETEAKGYRIAMAVSPSGKLIAYTPGERGFVVRNLGQDEPLFEFGNGNPPEAFAFSPDDSTLVTLTGSNFEFWDLAEKKVTRKQDIGFARGAFFAPDGKTVALANSKYAVRLFDAESGEERPQFETHYGEVKGVALNEDGTRLLTRGWVDAVFAWDVAAQKPTLSVGIRPISPKAMAITPDGKRAAYARSNRVHIYDAIAGEQVHELPVQSEALAASPDSMRLAVADVVEGQNGISLFDIESGERQKFLEFEQRALNICWLPDGKHLIASEQDGDIGLWDIAGGKLVRSFKRAIKGGVATVSVHPNGKVLVSAEGGFNAKLQFYRVDNGELLEVTLDGYDLEQRAEAQEAMFTGDGKYLVARIDWQLHVWDLKTRKRVAQYGTKGNYIGAFALSGDGKRLVTSSPLDHLLVWDLAELIATQSK